MTESIDHAYRRLNQDLATIRDERDALSARLKRLKDHIELVHNIATTAVAPQGRASARGCPHPGGGFFACVEAVEARE